MNKAKYTVMLTLMFSQCKQGITSIMANNITFDEAIELIQDVEKYQLYTYYNKAIAKFEEVMQDEYTSCGITLVETHEVARQALKYGSNILDRRLLHPFYERAQETSKEIAAKEMGELEDLGSIGFVT